MKNYYISVQKLEEAGYLSSLIGLSKSFKQKLDKMPQVAEKLANKDGGHNKFLESIIIWLDVKAPRYWWQEADTYRMSTKQSESTIHSLVKDIIKIPREVIAGKDGTIETVENYINNNFETGSICFDQFSDLYYACLSNDRLKVKKSLPEGYLQLRTWCMSYKTLRNIILQRQNHPLPHWNSFISQVLSLVDYPELLPKIDNS